MDLFIANELYTVSDVQGLEDIDLEKIGLKLGTRRRVVAEFGAQPSPASGGAAGPGCSGSSSSMFRFTSDPVAAASAQAAKSAAQAVASLKALRDGQRGGQKKAANARSVTQLSGSMSAYLSGGSGPSQSQSSLNAAASAESRSKAKIRDRLFSEPHALERLQSDDSGDDSENEEHVTPHAARKARSASGVGTSPSTNTDDEQSTLDELLAHETQPRRTSGPFSKAGWRAAGSSSAAWNTAAPSTAAAATTAAAAAATAPQATATAPPAAASPGTASCAASRIAAFDAQLGEIADPQLREIVRLFASPGSKALSFTASGTTLSAPLRKLYAEYSTEVVTDGLRERGLRPTVRIVRQAVANVGGRWPWVDKSQDADVQVLRAARKTLAAGEFSNVDTQVSRRPTHATALPATALPSIALPATALPAIALPATAPEMLQLCPNPLPTMALPTTAV